jgi:hypothetical protein
VTKIERVALFSSINASGRCFDFKAETTGPLGFELAGRQAQMLPFGMMTNLYPVLPVHVASWLINKAKFSNDHQNEPLNLGWTDSYHGV